MMSERKPVGGTMSLPRLRFPEFLSAPEWATHMLSRYIASLDAGVSVNAGDRSALDHEVGVLKTSCVSNGVFESAENKVVQGHDEIARVKEPVCANTIIISRMNTTALVGANAFVDNDIPNLFLPDRLWAAKATTHGNMRFLAYVLGSERGRASLSGLASGSSGTMKNIGKSEVLALPINAPSIEEQKRIADCLTSLDEVIAAQGRKVEALKAHKRGLMQQLFPREGETRPRLRFPEFRGTGNWLAQKLGDIAEISKGRGISKSDVVEDGNTQCIRYAELYTVYGEVIDRVRSRTNVPASDLVLSKAGDIIVPASGETKEDIATCACVVYEGIALGSDLNILRADVEGRFFSYYLNGSRRRELAKVAQGDTVAHLYPKQLEKLPICIPADKAEQTRIADCLSSLDTQINAESHQLAALNTHKQGLMQQLFPAPEGAAA